MKNGTYQYAIKMSAPIGPRHGKLELTVLGETAGGFLTLFSKRLPITGGSCRGDTLTFSGEMETLLYPLPYTAEGTVSEQAVRMVFHTAKGRFPAEGTAVTADERKKQES